MRMDPWGNELLEDYEHLFTEFGMQRVDESLIARMKNPGRLFSRRIIFGHRDFDKWLADWEEGKPVAVMSGIKPTGDFHLGSKLTAEELVFFQKEFGAKVFYCIADLEAWADNGIPLTQSHAIAVSNVADLLALGLDEKNAYIYKQSQERRVMNLAYIFARKTTHATLEALYGERNLGIYFSVLTQAGDIMLPQLEEFGGPKRVLVPVGADQDPHIRFARDIAQKFHAEYGFIEPAATFHKFFRSLSGQSKMSKREPMDVLSLADPPELVRHKIARCFTGGRATVEEQRKLGAEWWRCVNYELAMFHFEEGEEALARRREACQTGKLMCGQCKEEVIALAQKFIKQHQEKKKRMMAKAERLLSMV
ncbi:MAG: tryptophan--tRNA ligase [Candidatus Micrarchaeia archaeon]